MEFENLRKELRLKLENINPLLRANPWKRSHYMLVEEIIANELANSAEMTESKRRELGTTISYMTLRRFFEKKYDPNAVSDLRFLKSIDKLCIFLGYRGFSSFSSENKEGSMPDISLPDEKFFIDFVKDYHHAEFLCWKSSIKGVEPLVEPLVFLDGPFYARLKESMELIESRNLKLETDINRSSYELIEARVKSMDQDSCIVETREYWHMVLTSAIDDGRYIYNHENDQMYFFRKRDGKWKIWNNYNPNAGHFVKEDDINALLI